MSKKANPTLVGTFVIGAIALAIVSIVIIGNLKLQEKALPCVLYFSGSLHGLDIGAPVAFRGVQIGKVKKIQIDFDPQDSNYTIPVYIDIDYQLENIERKTNELKQSQVEQTQRLIAKGLRAKLKMRSIVTGKLYIDLAFYPSSEINFHGPKQHEDQIEIPTLPSGLEQITQIITELPLNDIVEKTNAVLSGLDRILNSDNSKQAITNLDHSLENLNVILNETRQSLPNISAQLKQGLTSFTDFSSAGTSLFTSLESSVGTITKDVQLAINEFNETAKILRQTFISVQGMVGADSDIAYDLSKAIRQLDTTAHSIQLLTDYLQRHPNALLFGQQGDK